LANKEFYRKIYAELDGTIEVREIEKSKKAKRYFFKNIDELEAYKAPLNKNIYIGIFSRLGRNGTTESCLTTKTLWADYDGVNINEVRKIIKDSNLPQASILVSSGHGVHAYWILKERVANEAIEIVKAIVMRSGADNQAAEKARVLRMPGTLNVKKEPFTKCEIIEFNEYEYEVHEFKKILKVELENLEKVKELTGSKEELKEFKNCSRSCIKFMAKGTDEGHRNFALCKMTKWLQLKGYTRRAALDIMRRWNTLNNPPKPYNQMLTEFNKVWDTDYKLLGCTFKKNKDLQEQCNYFCSMGECKHSSFQEIEEITSDNSCKIDNMIFQDSIFPNIKGLELAVYFTIAKTEGITREHLSEIIGIYKKNKNFIDSIDHLSKLNLIKIIIGNKRAKEKDLLILSNIYNNERGHTIVNNLLSEAFLGKRITDTEYKFLILLKSYSYMENESYPTEKTLARKMGKTERTIRSTLRSLEHKLYMKNTYVRRDDGSTKLYFKLLF
jgi:hypothetical protein